MSVKQEQRFQRANREHFDRQVEAARDRLDAGFLAGQIEDLQAQLEQERAKNQRALACVQRQRAYLDAAYDRQRELQAEVELEQERGRIWRQRYFSKASAWMKLSTLVRDLCSPLEVARWREANRDRQF
jgi:hypothetical protein